MGMRQSLTAVLERNTTLTGAFTTEPYEVAWAGEARWFVRALDRAGTGTRLRITTQVSPDGLHWCDLGDPVIADQDLTTWDSRNFGGWLRLSGTVESGDRGTDADVPSVKVLIYLALKS